jgi:hypothetical protein
MGNKQKPFGIKILSILRNMVALFSFAAPSIAGFVGISPKGRGMDAARR